MRTIVLFFKPVLIATIFLTACKNQHTMDSHSENAMMQIMNRGMEQMMNMAPTNDPDQDFAMMMRMHHQQAIDMAKEELKSGDNQAMRDMAQRMITAQQEEINQFTAFLNGRTPQPRQTEYNNEQRAAMDKMMSGMSGAKLTGDTDKDFALLMVLHHQSAIDMAQALLKYGNQATTRALAQTIITDQQQEIKELQGWLQINGVTQ